MTYGPHERHHLEVLSQHVHDYDLEPCQGASGHTVNQGKETLNTFLPFWLTDMRGIIGVHNVGSTVSCGGHNMPNKLHP